MREELCFSNGPRGVLLHSPSPPRSFDITSSLQRAQLWQEHQHRSSPLEGMGIRVFVKMVGDVEARARTVPTSLRCNLGDVLEPRLKPEWKPAGARVYLCVNKDSADEKQLASEREVKTNPDGL